MHQTHHTFYKYPVAGEQSTSLNTGKSSMTTSLQDYWTKMARICKIYKFLAHNPTTGNSPGSDTSLNSFISEATQCFIPISKTTPAFQPSTWNITHFLITKKMWTNYRCH